MTMNGEPEAQHRYRLYEDGCEFSPRCLECPLVACHHDYDDDGGKLRAVMETLEAGIATPEMRRYIANRPSLSFTSLSPHARDVIGVPILAHEGETERQHIRRMYEWGLNIAEISRYTGISEYYVKRHLNEEERDREQQAA